MSLPIVLMIHASIGMTLSMPDGIMHAVDVCQTGWQDGKAIFLVESTICIKGELVEGDDEIIRTGVTGKEIPTAMVVDSGGGDVDTALSIAEIIIGANLSMIVDGKCFSSCANYLLPAASYRYLLGGSAIGWHGGPPRTIDEHINMVRRSNLKLTEGQAFEIANRSFQKIQDLRKRQDALYESAGVSPKIIYDLEVAWNCLADDGKEEAAESARRGHFAFWSPSMYTLTSYYRFSNIIRLGNSPRDVRFSAVRLETRSSDEITSYPVNTDCLYKAYVERDLADEYLARAPGFDEPASVWLALPKVKEIDDD